MPTADAALAPPVAFHFTVSFGSTPPAVDGSFQEVSGIAPELETEPVAEGGENRFIQQLVAWCRNVLEGGLVRPIVPKLLHVFLLDANGAPLRAWSFANAYPVRWEVESFNSTKNELALEKIELSYAYSKREV